MGNVLVVNIKELKRSKDKRRRQRAKKRGYIGEIHFYGYSDEILYFKDIKRLVEEMDDIYNTCGVDAAKAKIYDPDKNQEYQYEVDRMNGNHYGIDIGSKHDYLMNYNKRSEYLRTCIEGGRI